MIYWILFAALFTAEGVRYTHPHMYETREQCEAELAVAEPKVHRDYPEAVNVYAFCRPFTPPEDA